jgi:phosphocarrier protein HPr
LPIRIGPPSREGGLDGALLLNTKTDGRPVKSHYDFGEENSAGLYLAEVVIPNRKGLHARASAQFVRCASGFNAEIRVTRDGHTVGGTSIMGLMMLAAGQGHTILIETEGKEARAAMEALIALVEARFGEDE